MKLIHKFLTLLYFGKARREGEARVLDTLLASAIIVLITGIKGRIELSSEDNVLLLSSIVISWAIRIWLRKE